MEAREAEPLDLAQQLDAQSFEIMNEYVDVYRVDGKTQADVLNTWGLLVYLHR